MPTPDIPVIDLRPLREEGEEGLRATARAVGEACRGVGFFYVAGHGVPADLRAATFDAARRLFAADPAVKEAVSFRRSTHNRGYIGLGAEALDPAKAADLKEAFNTGLDLPADDPEVVAGLPFRGVNLWPEMEGFRATLLAYFDAVWRLGRDLHRAFALDLGLPPDFFEARLDRPMATLRLLHYPPRPAAVAAGQLGAGAHTDYGNLTLLATDEVGGLEVRRRDGGGWIPAPVVPDAFVCNIGDCLMRWTNDSYVSTPHRVVSPAGRERYSVAFFLDPNPDALVACLDTCAGPERPAKYPPVTAADYLRQRLDATYAHRQGG